MARDGRSRRYAGIGDGTFAAVIRAYQSSPDYAALAPSTRSTYGYALRIAESPDSLGAIPTAILRPALVQSFLDAMADTPGAQKNARTAIMAVERWALVRDLLPYPISTGTYTAALEGGHEPWSDAHVELAERHARPDLARVVLLAVHTGQRGSDIVRMRFADLEDREGHPGINVRQQKTGMRLWVPLTAALTAELATWERRPPFFLVLKADGSPFTRAHLSWHWNHERDNNPALEPLRAAGLVLHGLRATAVVRLRRRGATTLQIASMIGMSEPMVARYSRLADQTDLALASVHILDGTTRERAARKAQKKNKIE